MSDQLYTGKDFDNVPHPLNHTVHPQISKAVLILLVIIGLGAIFLTLSIIQEKQDPRSLANEQSSQAVQRFVNNEKKGLIWDGLEEPQAGSPCFVKGHGKGKGLLEIKDKKTGKVTGCTHGPDPAPEGVDIKKSVEPVSAAKADSTVTIVASEVTGSSAVATTTTGSVPCDGDGTSGKRIQAIYARASDVPDRYDEFVSSFQIWATQTNSVFVESGLQTGQARNLRFVHDANCNVVVARVTLSPTGDDVTNNTFDELKAQGYDRKDRKNLVWVDANVYCGMGTILQDDRPTSDNANNGNPFGGANLLSSYARVDSGCWGLSITGTSTEAHEIMHNFGGVQPSAPRHDGGYHCTENYDLMCYDNYPIVAGCTDRINNVRFDCNHDDYFYAGTPPAGNYLATYWNTANSGFLIEGVAPSPAPSPTPTPTPTPTPIPLDTTAPVVTISLPINGAKIRSTVIINASATDNKGVTRMQVYIDGVLHATSSTPSISYTWNSSKVSRGTHTIRVTANDLAGNVGSSSVSVTKQ